MAKNKYETEVKLVSHINSVNMSPTKKEKEILRNHLLWILARENWFENLDIVQVRLLSDYQQTDSEIEEEI